MFIIRAIDLLGGQVVRLKQGDYNQKTVYSDNPLAVAKRFEREGAEWLHIVDLDGARTGEMKNLKHILAMREAVKISMQVGGGARSLKTIALLLKNGIDRVVIGTRALEDERFLSNALERFGSERIAVSLDVKDDMPHIRGWVSSRNALRRSWKVRVFLALFKKLGLQYLIYTDITRDGMQTGPNFQAIKKISSFGFKLIASGGVSSIGEVRRLEKEGVHGCIVGRAVYEDGDFLEDINKKGWFNLYKTKST